jgi:hypothetical protein
MAFGLCIALNLIAFMCVANSNPGYVDENEERRLEMGERGGGAFHQSVNHLALEPLVPA